MINLSTDPEAVEAALRVLVAPGDVFEIRALHASKWRGMIGYFDDPAIAAEAVGELTEPYVGVYVTLNPITPDALYRANNSFTKFVENLGSKDHDITGRVWLPIDIDPVRTTGISSTAQEQRAAVKLASVIASTLELTYGFPEPYIASSGNGSHLLYPVSVPNDVTSRDTFKEFMKTIATAFSTPQCKVDTSVFNASRIWRLYGTIARKGSDAPERPHRMARIVSAPAKRELVPFKLIREVARADLGRIESEVSKPRKPAPIPYPADEARWRELNRLALKQLTDWVPAAFGDDARPYLNGYRISSDALGRDREEDLSIQPLPIGILDFGEHDMEDKAEGHRTPVSVLAEWLHDGDKQAAAYWLADAIDAKESEFEGLAEKYAKDDDEEFLDDEPKDTATHVKGFDITSVRSASSIVKKTYKQRTMLVDNLLPRGAYLLIARPKMGKSWLALQLAIAKAKGGNFLGSKVSKGKALMLLLEEREERFKGRLDKLGATEEIDNLLVVPLDALVDNQFPRGEQGCMVLRKLVENDPEIDLVVIDTFSLFRDHEGEQFGGVYDRDYASVMPIIRMCSELEISAIVVHHERKGATVAGKQDADFMEAANGSAGLTAAFEGVMRIEGLRTEEQEEEDAEQDEDAEKPHEPLVPRKLKISGRDIERDVIVRNMSFDVKKGGWYRTGRVNVENAILQAIRSSLSMTLTDLCSLLPVIPKNEVKRVLAQLTTDNILVKTNYNYSLEYAGEAGDVPQELLANPKSVVDVVLKLVEWRGSTPMSFLYEAIKDYPPASVRAAVSTLFKSGSIKRRERGEYLITKKGAARLANERKGESDDADDLC